MHIFALTGGIASGKSTVSNYMKGLGCPVIDADLIARQVVEPYKPAWKAIVGHFGVEVLLDSGEINRPKLGEIVFGNAEKRQLLNTCTHPYITKEIFIQIVKNFLKGEPFVLLVSPLLFESNRFLRLVKMTIVVSCSPEQQLERVMNRDGFSEEEARQRIASQLPLSEKVRRAKYVIDNSQEVRFTQQQAFALYHEMRRMSMYRGLYKWLVVLVLLLITFATAVFFS